MSTRSSTRISSSASANLSRSTSRSIQRDPVGGALRIATTIAFSAPATITDSGNGLGAYRVGQRIVVRGSARNSRTWTCATVAAGAITVTEGRITTEAAGPRVSISPED